VNVHLVTVVGGYTQLLDCMLRHYRDMGVDSLLVNVQLETYGDDLYKEVQVVASRYNAEIVSVFVGKWNQSVNPYLYRHTMEQAPRDWFVLADCDELQVYPKGLFDTISAADRGAFDYIEGFVVDRVAADGVLRKVDRHESLWEQFSLAGFVTHPLLRGNCFKVAAAKGSVRLLAGQHYALQGRAWPRNEDWIAVHHFKWTDGLLERMRARVRFYKSVGDCLWTESQRLVDYLEQSKGRINIDEPQFLLRLSTKHCPHEGELKAYLLAHEQRMPRPSTSLISP
jgi:hypothetical protein